MNGVSRKQVTSPDKLDCIEFIPTPLELLMEIIEWFIESNPVIGDMTLTSDIVWLGTSGINDESSLTSPVKGLITIKLGAFKKSEPPDIILTVSIISKLSMLTTGDMNASGLKVLSEEYS